MTPGLGQTILPPLQKNSPRRRTEGCSKNQEVTSPVPETIARPCIECQSLATVGPYCQAHAEVEEVRRIVRHDFPVDIFPGRIATFVRTFAAATPSPLAWVGASVLNICAASLGPRSRVKIKDNWVERSVNWTALVGDSGSRKTPTVAPLIAPLREIEKRLFRESGAAKREWAETAKKDRGPEPGWKQLIFTDVTFEALIRAFQHNSTLWGEFDELSSFLRSMGQYKQGGGSDRDHWLSLWSSGVINYQRVKDDLRIYVEDVHASLLGGVQPPKLKMLRDESGDGLEYRFNYAGGEHIPLSEATGTPAHQEWYAGNVRALYERPARTYDAPKDCFDLLCKKEKQYISDGVELGIATKGVAYIARHALPLHALRCQDTGFEVPLTCEDFERAAEVQDNFVETWETLIGKKLARQAPSSDREVTIYTLQDLAEAMWVRVGKGWVGRSKIMQGGWAGLGSKRKMDALVALIRELGEDSIVELRGTGRSGSPMEFRVRRNPT